MNLSHVTKYNYIVIVCSYFKSRPNAQIRLVEILKNVKKRKTFPSFDMSHKDL